MNFLITKITLTLCFQLQKLAKSEEEDVVGTYFKPIRASKLMAQAQETQRVGSNSKCKKIFNS